MKKNIAVITNATADSGVGSRAYELIRHMGEQEDFQIVPVVINGNANTMSVDGAVLKSLSTLPGMLGSKSISWIRLARHLPDFDVFDITNQTLSFIAKKHHPSIVTVHDIIELTDPQERKARIVNKFLMGGITQADRIVTVSQYTKKTLCEYFNLDASAITVIPNGVHAAYQEIPDYTSSIAYQQLVREYGIKDRNPIVLSVGSEHPRKNMKAVLQTIALLKKQFPNILLIKVGDAGLLSGRKETLALLDELNLKDSVLLLGKLPHERLNELYAIASALLFPSRNEGFGLPLLEAMASACPVVTSNTTSIPEVVGDAACMHDPDDIEGFTNSIMRIISDSSFKNDVIEKGKKRAALFSWSAAAEQTLALYRGL